MRLERNVLEAEEGRDGVAVPSSFCWELSLAVIQPLFPLERGVVIDKGLKLCFEVAGFDIWNPTQYLSGTFYFFRFFCNTLVF